MVKDGCCGGEAMVCAWAGRVGERHTRAGRLPTSAEVSKRDVRMIGRRMPDGLVGTGKGEPRMLGWPVEE